LIIEDMKAIGFVRVSTEKQADFGVSLEAQSEKVRAMAVVQGAELAEVIIDAGESAKSLNRPWHGASSVPGGRRRAGWCLNIMTAVSQWEREAIGERTRDAMHHKRANGERVGTVAFGFRTAADGLHLEADPAEQGLLRFRASDCEPVGALEC
jgi:DNA invertase Pin-like site-specific DNA recombinase